MTDDQTNAIEEAAAMLHRTAKTLRSVAARLDEIILEIDSQPHPENVTTVKEDDA